MQNAILKFTQRAPMQHVLPCKGYVIIRCKNVFYVFYCGHVFTFFNVFLFSVRF